MKNFILKVFLVTTLGFVGFITSLSAQEFSEEIRVVKHELSKLGFTIEAEKTFKLKEGKTETGSFSFGANKCYMVFAFSEKDVREVDFSIYEGDFLSLGQIEEFGISASMYYTYEYPATAKFMLKNVFSRKAKKSYESSIIVTSLPMEKYNDYYGSTSNNWD